MGKCSRNLEVGDPLDFFMCFSKVLRKLYRLMVKVLRAFWKVRGKKEKGTLSVNWFNGNRVY